MKKKALSLALALVLCLGLTVPAFAGRGFDPEPLDPSQYSIQNGVLTIHEGVTRIGHYAFEHIVFQQKITGIVFPSTLTELAEEAFHYCPELTNVTIPGNVTSIGWGAFSDCISLTSVTIENGVTSIEDSMFSGCTNLTSVTIPDSVTSIGGNAFKGCTSLTNVTIPDSVTSIGGDRRSAFSGCTGLTNPEGLVIADGILLEYDGNGSNVIIPNGVRKIWDHVFHDCKSLTNVSIPTSVTSIGNYAFDLCRGLTNVTIPSSVTTIGKYAFRNCTGLTNVILKNGITCIKNDAFSNCASLNNVTIPSSIICIEDGVFSNCSSLTSITIPDSVTSIKTRAFGNCNSLADVYYGGSEAEWHAIEIESFNTGLSPYNATIHYNSPMPEAPSQPQQPSDNQPTVSNWAKDFVVKAQDNDLIPDGLGNNYTADITRAQFAAAAVKLYEAMSGTKAPAAGENPFNDTSDSVIIQAAALGFVSGVGNGKFDPNALVNREQAAVMLSGVYTKLGGNIPAVTATNFADNGDVSNWAQSAVAFMNDKGIISGTGNNSFSPKGGATIEQALTISLRMFENLK